ncbi:hypothetical protein [Rhizobium leguminosarum]|uniref:hypothetical protein n=1 Tax=Rhizobium leguminosarum TaxID=384 RepID=UPI001C93963F|nr:hypothetical protein [Rhizobium leguminosarum]
MSSHTQQLSLSDWLGLLGIILSLVGFGVSLVQIRKTKNAAESARDAATLATESVRKLDSVISFATVSKALSEMKDTLIKEDYELLAGLFDKARKALIDARENHPGLTDDQRRSIQKALSFLKSLEIDVRTLDNATLKQQHAKFVKTLLEISDNVTTILIKTRSMEAAL